MANLRFRSRPAPARREDPAPPVAARMAGEPMDPEDDHRKRDRWWYESSYDLKHGLEVDDSIGQTIPREIIDRLFNR